MADVAFLSVAKRAVRLDSSPFGVLAEGMRDPSAILHALFCCDGCLEAFACVHAVERPGVLDKLLDVVLQVVPGDVMEFRPELRIIGRVRMEGHDDRLLDESAVLVECCGIAPDLEEMGFIDPFAGLEVDERGEPRLIGFGIFAAGGAIEVELPGIPLAGTLSRQTTLPPVGRGPRLRRFAPFRPRSTPRASPPFVRGVCLIFSSCPGPLTTMTGSELAGHRLLGSARRVVLRTTLLARRGGAGPPLNRPPPPGAPRLLPPPEGAGSSWR